jgi:hypothetical protein
MNRGKKKIMNKMSFKMNIKEMNNNTKTINSNNITNHLTVRIQKVSINKSLYIHYNIL